MFQPDLRGALLPSSRAALASGRGRPAIVVGMTLAMMEELGNYKADYSQAECMLWGRNQGCDFVETRCGTRRDDLGRQEARRGARHGTALRVTQP